MECDVLFQKNTFDTIFGGTLFIKNSNNATNEVIHLSQDNSFKNGLSLNPDVLVLYPPI
jgi:hypothetical protein